MDPGQSVRDTVLKNTNRTYEEVRQTNVTVSYVESPAESSGVVLFDLRSKVRNLSFCEAPLFPTAQFL